MPWEPNSGANQGIASANQSHLQTLLEGLREQQETARFQAENLVDVDPSNLHPAARSFGTPLPNGMLRFNKSVLPTAAAAGEKALAREQSVQEQTATANAIDTLHPPGGEPMPQELRGPYAMLRSGVPAHPDALKAAVDYLAGKKNLVEVKDASGRTQQINAASGKVVAAGEGPPGQTQLGDLPFGYRWKSVTDGKGLTSNEAVPLNAMEHFNAAQRAIRAGDNRTAQMHLDAANYAPGVPWTEGGGVQGRANLALGIQPGGGATVAGLRASMGEGDVGASGAPAGPTVSRGSMQGPQKPADPTTVHDLNQIDTSKAQIANLLEGLKDPEVQAIVGSALQNPRGALAVRGNVGTSVLGVPVRTALTDKQAQFKGNVDMLRTQVQRAMEGLRPNSMFIEMLKGALPTVDDPNIKTKLGLLQTVMNDKRFIAETAEGNINRKAPPSVINQRPSAAGKPAPAPAAGVSGSGPSFDPAADARARAKYGLSGR